MPYVAENEAYRLIVEYDDDPMCPRENDNVGTMVCWHRHYSLGDKHKHDDPRDFLEDLAQDYVGDVDFEDMSMDDLLAVISEHAVIMPLFLYDHGGISMSTSTFVGRAQHAEWDSGQVGWVYVTHAKAQYESCIKEPLAEVIDWAEMIMTAEVEEYDKYLRGDVYGFVLEEKHRVDTCPECDGTGFVGVHETCPECSGSGHTDEPEYEYESTDSCWGFFGSDFSQNGMYDCMGSPANALIGELEWRSRV